RASEGNGAAAERHRGAHLLAIEPRPSGCPTRRSRASGRGSAAGRTGKKEVLKKRCNTRTSEDVTHPSTTLAQARLTEEF
ncbi:hypothetical protein PIB30_114432, partial [Stylosanthes scabra]|nr:hypothetical protein [Stylosanthes scabra]